MDFSDTHLASWWGSSFEWLWWVLCSLVDLGCGHVCGGRGCLTSYGDGIVTGWSIMVVVGGFFSVVVCLLKKDGMSHIVTLPSCLSHAPQWSALGRSSYQQHHMRLPITLRCQMRTQHWRVWLFPCSLSAMMSSFLPLFPVHSLCFFLPKPTQQPCRVVLLSYLHVNRP